MRDSLNAGPLSRRGERSSRQKRPTPSEMPIAPGKKKDRGRARGASPPSQQRKLDPDDRPSSSSRKRPRVLTQMGGGSSRLQRPDPSISPPPSRKRGRPTNEERLRREKDCGRSTSQGRGRRGLSSSGSRSSSSLPRSNVSGTSDLTVVLSVPSRPAAVPATATTTNASTATASVPRVAPVTATASSTSPSWPFMFQQQPQRQTRSRPVDQDRMMQVFIGDGPQSKGPRGGSSSNGGGSNHSANCSSSSSSNTSTSDLGEAVQTLEAFAHQNNRDTTQGGVASASNRGGARYGSGGTGGASRRHAGRRGAAGARARGASASPGRRGSSASAAVVATPTAAAAAPAATAAAATATTGGESTGQAKMESMGSSDHVIVPKFRLHSLFISGDSIASEGGAQKGGMMRAGPGTGSRRKRPASGKAAAASGAESIAPPQPPRGGRDSGFLELTKNSLVRASHTAVFGSDYDLDDEDCAFLEKLNAISGDGAGSDGGGVESSSRSRPRLSRSAHNQGSGRGDGSGSEETGRTISEDLFEAMIEKLERQESRARDVRVFFVFFCTSSVQVLD